MPKGIATSDQPVVDTLNRVVDAGLMSTLFIAPLALAGRFAIGRLLLIAIIGVTAVAWGFTRILSAKPKSWFVSGAEWLIAAAIGVVMLQLVPMPASFVEALSPSVVELLPLHHGTVDGEASIHWYQLSLAPHATRGALAMIIAYAILFVLVVNRLRKKEDLVFLMKSIALAGVSMSSIGLAQRFVGNGKFLWFIEHPSRDTLVSVKGTFVNENHFVHFLALTLGALLWWIVTEQRATESEKPKFSASHGRAGIGGNRIARNQIVPFLGLIIVALAALLSFSRGGLAVMAIAAITCTGLFMWQKLVGKRALIGVGIVCGIAALCVWVHGRDLLARELGTLQNASIESLDQNGGRRKIWSAATTAIPNHALLGTGLGSHRYVYPTYFSDESNIQYTHAESGYLHTMFEAGSAGFVLLLWGIGLSGFWIIRSLLADDSELASLAVPLASGWLVSVSHAAFDFNWFIPANMTLLIFLLAAAARCRDFAKSRVRAKASPIPSRLGWSFATLGIAWLTLFSTIHYLGPARAESSWSEYRAWSFATKRFSRKSVGSGRQRNIGFIDPGLPETNASMIAMLDETVGADPNHGRAHVRLAALCLRQFDLLQRDSESQMGLAQIRDAALASEFPTHQAMVDWVMKVAGENGVLLERILWHAKRGVQLTPTEGSGYLYLGEVAFLDPALRGRAFELLAQAHKVRPYDASVQFVYGRQLLLNGEQEEATKLWKQAFRRGSSVRRRIITSIGPLAPPKEILETFQPDVYGLKDLFDYYQRQKFEPQAKYVGVRYVEQLEEQAKLLSGESAGELWFLAQYVHATLGNTDAAVEAAKNAVLSQPRKYDNHFACALRQRDAGNWEAAIKEFRWCSQRKPQNEELPLVIAEMKQKLRQSEMSATALHAERIGR